MKKIFLIAISALSLIACEQKEETPEVLNLEGKTAVIDNMLSRRSIRKYTDEQVAKKQLDTIMKCAIYAPSALNKQPWEIRVIQNQEILNEINQRFLNYAEGKEFKGSAAHYREPDFSIFHGAPTVIVMARDKSSAISYMDCGIALQNILLSSKALGLGTCPLGTLVPILNLEENSDLLELINIPEGYEVAINIALGYPAENPEAPERYSDKVKIIE